MSASKDGSVRSRIPRLCPPSTESYFSQASARAVMMKVLATKLFKTAQVTPGRSRPAIYLSCKPESLTLIPGTPIKSWVRQHSDLSARGSETGGSLALTAVNWSPGPLSLLPHPDLKTKCKMSSARWFSGEEHLLPTLTTWVQSLGCTWCKDRTSSHRLSSDFRMCTECGVYTDVHRHDGGGAKKCNFFFS